MKPITGKLWWTATAAILLQLTGCASFEFAKAAPAQQQPVALKLSGEELSGMTDLPLGVHRIPDSHVIVSGHQKGSAAGLLFGLVGVAVVHAANASSGESAVAHAQRLLQIKLDEPVRAEMRALAASPEYARHFTLDEAAGGNRLLITPGLVLSFVTDASVRPYVVLKASLAGSDGKPIWTTRYIASGDEARTLAGDDGWLAGDAAPLRQAVLRDLRVAMQTLAADVSRPYVRDETRLTMVQGHFPHVKQRLQTVGFLLKEDDQYLTYVPRIGDAIIFSGVNIIEKKGLVHRPATKDDAPFKIVP